MSEEIKNDKPEQDAPEQPAAEPKDTDKKEHMIPKSRLDEVIQERNEMQSRIEALEKASKEAEEQRLKDQEQWKELAEKRQQELESLKPKAAIAEEQEKTLQNYLEAQIQDIPETLHSLIPEQLTTMQKLQWLAKNKAKLIKPSGPDIGAGVRGASGQTVEIPQGFKDASELFNLTPEQRKRAAERLAEKNKK